jgi:hypothetical protein
MAGRQTHTPELMEKNFRPHAVNPMADSLHDAYGISEHRRLHISAQLDKIFKQSYARGADYLHVIVDKIADVVETKEEFAWAMVTHMMWLAAKGYLGNNNPRQLLRRDPPPQN